MLLPVLCIAVMGRHRLDISLRKRNHFIQCHGRQACPFGRVVAGGRFEKTDEHFGGKKNVKNN